jgi:hypothetical protein
MSRRINESARVLNFFKQADLAKAEQLYELVQDEMKQRLAPAKVERKAKAEVKKRVSKDTKETNLAADQYVTPV